MNTAPSCTICTRHACEPGGPCEPTCRAPRATLGVTCERCADRIRGNLDELLVLWERTEDPGWPSAGTGGIGGKTKPLPGGTDWLSWRQGAELFGTLGSWARDWQESFGLVGPSDGRLPTVVRWLTTHLEGACSDHPAIEEFASEVGDLVRLGRRAARTDQATGQRVLCPAEVGGATCGRRLAIDVARPEELVACRSCGTRWTSARLLLVALGSSGEAWIDPEAAGRLVNRSPATLQRWARSGRIVRRNGLYLLQSVREAALIG